MAFRKFVQVPSNTQPGEQNLPVPCGEPCNNAPKKIKLLEMFSAGWSFSSSIAHWAGRGFRTTTEEQYEERRSICTGGPEGKCPSNKLKKIFSVVDQCGVCNCVIALKASLIEEKDGKSDCPLGHWPVTGKTDDK